MLPEGDCKWMLSIFPLTFAWILYSLLSIELSTKMRVSTSFEIPFCIPIVAWIIKTYHVFKKRAIDISLNKRRLKHTSDVFIDCDNNATISSTSAFDDSMNCPPVSSQVFCSAEATGLLEYWKKI